eukprot:TRINITY_DN588_c0_g1_i1.p1 TRINITY_DN588_c0_g1~~TRINITY_DN588_c0_g1_i1.p1  ORF type:complete len:567 (-),score=87.29 TRINITY_DN588_c0_g1_i1:148-1848(-)
MMANSQHRCVFVGNIPYDATEEQLIQICEEVGPVVSFRLVLDRETGKPKGYGFCEYKDEETALSARRNLQGYEINGRQLRVDFAENDKGSDRNREQGRGGPGFTANIDAQKPPVGPAILGDSALHQPIGFPLAATAASVMAGALGDAQTSTASSTQNGFQSQSALGSDPLTHYLAKMSRNQLNEIMSEMKVMATQNKALARQLLLSSPQLPKALFQAQIMLGMVTPQVLQMSNIRQSPSISLPQPSLQEGQPDQQLVLSSHHGQTPLAQNKMQAGLLPRIPESQLPPMPQNAMIPPPLSIQHVPVQPRFQHPQQAQPQVLLQTTMSGQSGVSTVPSIRPQPLTGLPVRPQIPSLGASNVLKQQIQTPLLQHPRAVGAANLGHHLQLPLPNSTLPHSLLHRPLTSLPSYQLGASNSSILQGQETVLKETGTSAPMIHDSTWVPRSNGPPNLPVGYVDQIRTAGDTPNNRPSKLARLEDGDNASHVIKSSNSSAFGSVPAQISGTSSMSINKVPISDGVQHSDKQDPQIPPEVESALLQQVMSLTAEQLSSLPPEQRQQVIQLQQMLR